MALPKVKTPESIAGKKKLLAQIEAELTKFEGKDMAGAYGPKAGKLSAKNMIRKGILQATKTQIERELKDAGRVVPAPSSVTTTAGLRSRLANIVAQDAVATASPAKPKFAAAAAEILAQDAPKGPKSKIGKGLAAYLNDSIDALGPEKAAEIRARGRARRAARLAAEGVPTEQPVKELKTAPKPKPASKVVAEAAKPVREVTPRVSTTPFTGQYSWWAEDPLTIQEDAAAAARKQLLRRMASTDAKFGKSLAGRFGETPAQLGFDMGMGRTATPLSSAPQLGFDVAAGLPGGGPPPPPGQTSFLTDAGRVRGGVPERVAGKANVVQDLLRADKSFLMNPRMLRAASIAKGFVGPGAIAATALMDLPNAYQHSGFGFEDNQTGKPTLLKWAAENGAIPIAAAAKQEGSFLKWLADKATDVFPHTEDPKAVLVGANGEIPHSGPSNGPHGYRSHGPGQQQTSANPGSMVYAVKTSQAVDDNSARTRFLRSRGYDLAGKSGALNAAAAARDFVQPTKSHPTTTSFVKTFGLPTSQRDTTAFNAIYSRPKWMTR